ncbi:MAG: hypothetical protein WC288_00240 [Candidatus Paceibacterota bacterium]|jgi:hypothetical protein|nr:hypothetical protein [Candidatus Paceibacterota bacterium]
MNKINYNILIFVLSFSLVFIIFPFKTFSACKYGYVKLPDGTYHCPSYANHIVEPPPTTTPGSSGKKTCHYNTCEGGNCKTVTLKYSSGHSNPCTGKNACSTDADCGGGGGGGGGDATPTCTYYACRSANSCSLRQLNQATCPANQCSSNADCGGSTTTTPPSSSRWSCSVNQKQCHQNTNGAFTSYSSCMAYCNPSSTPTPTAAPPPSTRYSCNTSTGQCYAKSSGSYSSLSSCQAACKPSSSTPTTTTTTTTLTRYACNQENGTCYSNPNGPYSSIASCENNCFRKPCTIDIFTINDKDTSPIRVWVTQLNQGHWSASDYCDNCNISCSPYPDCLWQKDNIGTGGPGAIYQFKLKEYGSYTYTLTCFNSFGDRPSETLQVNAVNLPWWREIIPVLPGSLWGIIKK